MSKQANIRSIDVIGALRGKCVETGETLRRIIDECLGEVRRTMTWVESTQLDYWKREFRKREQKFQSARSDLERAKISNPDADPRSFTDQNRALKKAKSGLDEAQDKIRAVKRWTRELQRQYMLFNGGLRPLATAADLEMPKAAAWLAALEQHLGGYLEVMPPMPDAESAPGDDRSFRRATPGEDDAPEEENA